MGFLSKKCSSNNGAGTDGAAAAYWIGSSCLELPSHCPNSPLESNPLLRDCYHSNQTSEWRKNTFEKPSLNWMLKRTQPSPVWVKRWSFLQIVFSSILREIEAFFLLTYSMLILKPYPEWKRSLFLPLYPSKDAIREDLIRQAVKEDKAQQLSTCTAHRSWVQSQASPDESFWNPRSVRCERASPC